MPTLTAFKSHLLIQIYVMTAACSERLPLKTIALLFVLILAAQPESMVASMARDLTLEPMGRQGKGLRLRDYTSFNIKVKRDMF